MIHPFFQIIRDTNNQVGKMKQMEELISIANKLEFQKLKVSTSQNSTTHTFRTISNLEIFRHLHVSRYFYE